MPKRRRSSYLSLAIRSTELALAAPRVVAHRVTRAALAGSNPSSRDRREFERMHAEKVAAFTESWSAMTVAAMRANQATATALMRSFWSAPWGVKPMSAGAVRRSQRAAVAVLNRGLAPVHRTAVANARRLGRSKLR